MDAPGEQLDSKLRAKRLETSGAVAEEIVEVVVLAEGVVLSVLNEHVSVTCARSFCGSEAVQNLDGAGVLGSSGA